MENLNPETSVVSSLPTVDLPKESVRPIIAASFVAVIVYIWMEAPLRIAGAFTTFSATWRVWGPRDGFITAMWLTMVVVGIVAFVVSYALLRNRTRLGSLTTWTVILVVSAIVAPLIAEWGQLIGV